MIAELDIVALVHDLPEYGLKTGDVGTVVLCHGDQAFEVEFVTFGGDTIAIVTLDKKEIRPVAPGEMQHARQVESRG